MIDTKSKIGPVLVLFFFSLQIAGRASSNAKTDSASRPIRSATDTTTVAKAKTRRIASSVSSRFFFLLFRG